ncbi:hypothetical protein HZC00_01105 [Candidatus Kaiserbacteria bacterium]|nr:hypothetical protein [Candidatus Kaiserbacteria bacterium]
MTLDALIMLVGALVAILPFLGFPNGWDSALLFILGVIIIGLGIVVRRRESHLGSSGNRHTSPQSKQTFVEAAPSGDSVTPQE